MNRAADRRHITLAANHAHEIVITATARERALRAEFRGDDLEDEAGVIFELAAEFGGEFGVDDVDPQFGHELKAAVVGVDDGVHGGATFAEKVLEAGACGLRRTRDREIAFDE